MYTLKDRDKLKPLSIYKYYRIANNERAIPVDSFNAQGCYKLNGTILLDGFVYGWFNTVDRQLQKTVVRYGKVSVDSVNYSFIKNEARIVV